MQLPESIDEAVICAQRPVEVVLERREERVMRPVARLKDVQIPQEHRRDGRWPGSRMFRSPRNTVGTARSRVASAAEHAASHFCLRSVFSNPASRNGTYAPMTWTGPPVVGKVLAAARAGR